MNKMEEIQVIVLNNGLNLISKVSQVSSDLGEPDCKLNKPFLIIDDKIRNVKVLEPWLSDLTENDDSILISSDKILTLVDPKETLLNNYLSLIK